MTVNSCKVEVGEVLKDLHRWVICPECKKKGWLRYHAPSASVPLEVWMVDHEIDRGRDEVHVFRRWPGSPK
jgi:hypothetical protein